jgi:hypothetical protein
MHYLRAVFCRPASQYVALTSACFLVLGFFFCFVGAGIASQHNDPVRFGPLEWLVAPCILLAFIGLLGIPTREEPLAFLSENEGTSFEVWRLVWVAIFGFGGGLMGLSVLYFRWIDYVPLPPGTTTPPPRGSTTPPTLPPGPHTLLPAYMLLAEVLCLWASLGFAWVAMVFYRQERNHSRGEDDGMPLTS